MIFGLTQGLNVQGAGVSHDLNPDAPAAQNSAFVCLTTVCRPSTTLEPVPIGPNTRTEDLDVVTETIDNNCEVDST